MTFQSCFVINKKDRVKPCPFYYAYFAMFCCCNTSSFVRYKIPSKKCLANDKLVPKITKISLAIILNKW